jgi:hypothetical protein
LKTLLTPKCTESVFNVELADIVPPEDVEVCGGKVVFVVGIGIGTGV